MNIREYIKHRWYFFVIVGAVIVFSWLVVWASSDANKSDYLYILQGVFLAMVIFAAADFLKLNSRIKYMQEYMDSRCADEIRSNYPLDIKYAAMIKERIDEFQNYKDITQDEHSNELEFITKWVHDVKVPVSAIKLLIENNDSTEAQHIEMQLNYIEQNIEKILYNMKSKTFYDDYRITKVNIKSIVNKALKSYAVFFSYKSISLDININDYYVYTDEKWSIYIISQLISNAVKYTNDGGKIDIYAIDKDNKIVLNIRNTGKGIEETSIKNIFKRGYSSYTTREDKSTGYGLYLANKLADKMGHVIDATSEIDQVTEFSLYYDKMDEYM